MQFNIFLDSFGLFFCCSVLLTLLISTLLRMLDCTFALWQYLAFLFVFTGACSYEFDCDLRDFGLRIFNSARCYGLSQNVPPPNPHPVGF